MIQVPSHELTLRHAAIAVTDMKRSLELYTQVLGFQNYHTTDSDWAMVSRLGTTLSLVRVTHKNPVSLAAAKGSHPAHLGLVASSHAAVDALHAKLKAVNGIQSGSIESHRDGSRGFYFTDFDGNQFEIIFIPYRDATRPVSTATVLIAHGSREEKWQKPFRALKDRVQEHLGKDAIVELCYMEFCEPTLEQVVGSIMARDKSMEIVLMPVFLASGGHVDRDIPLQVESARKQFGCKIEIKPPLLESSGVAEAFTAAIIDAVR
jgi:sirohydrochlorin cobaltochelatase